MTLEDVAKKKPVTSVIVATYSREVRACGPGGASPDRRCRKL